MDAKRMVTGTVVGAAVLYAAGYLIFDVAFGSFYAANVGSATGVNRTERIEWAMAAANLAYGALVAFVILTQSGKVSLGRGAWIGAIVGCLAWATVDFVFYGTSNIANLVRTLVDPVLEFVHGGIAGAAVAAAVGMVGTPGRRA